MKANEKQAVNAVTGLFTEVLNVVQIKVGQHNKKKISSNRLFLMLPVFLLD